MNVIKVEPAFFAANSYILTADGKTAVLIDCAEESLYAECAKLGLKPVAVLLTHGHFDHVCGCGKFYNNGVPIIAGSTEKDYIFSPDNLGIFGGVDIPHFALSRTVDDGEKLTLAGIDFTVISTPGHTAGGVCYIAEKCLFTGDTLFFGSIGRTDLPGGDARVLKESLKKIKSLDGDYTVYCGHGEDTTLDSERTHNPYIKYL